MRDFQGTVAAGKAGVHVIRLQSIVDRERMKPDAEGWMSIFNGRDLTGWKTTGGEKRAYVKDGCLVSEQGGNFYYPAAWEEYDLECELVAEGARVGNMVSLSFGHTSMQGIECRFRLIFHHAGCLIVRTPVKWRVWQSKANMFPLSEWTRVMVKLRRDSLEIAKDGVKVAGAPLKAVPEKKGGLLFYTGEGGNTARFRNIRVRVLDKVKPAAPPRTLTLDLGGGVTMELVYIKPGRFVMGSPDTDKSALPWEGPQHEVHITRGFYAGKYEVTQAQYECVIGTNPSRFKGPDRPVETVSWDDAAEFCKRLSQRSGQMCRLPTEAVWEYACRGGTTGRYHFGDDLRMIDDYAWHSGNSGKRTNPVGQKLPNALGLHDMPGNVCEWCRDRFSKSYYGESPGRDPRGPATGTNRVLRGGSWASYSRSSSVGHCRSACRTGNSHAHAGGDIGFRAAVSSPPRGQ